MGKALAQLQSGGNRRLLLHIVGRRQTLTWQGMGGGSSRGWLASQSVLSTVGCGRSQCRVRFSIAMGRPQLAEAQGRSSPGLGHSGTQSESGRVKAEAPWSCWTANFNASSFPCCLCQHSDIHDNWPCPSLLQIHSVDLP